MKNSLLIPNKYKVIGWMVFVVFIVLGFFCLTKEFKIPNFRLYHNKGTSLMSNFPDYNLTNEFAILGITVGLLMIMFSKEKAEDEYIAVLRLKSLQWAVLVSYVILLCINFSFYGISFLLILIYNIWTVPIVFLIKFNYNLYRLRKEGVSDEK